MNANIRRLGLFFIVAFAIMVGDITYWQVIDASSIAARPDNPRLTLEASKIKRGLIFDRNSILLANRSVGTNGFVSRSYTDPSLSQIIGYDSTRYGKTGLELSYDDYLSGSVLGTSWKELLNQWEHKSITGDNLTLTIDDKLQQEVAALLPDQPSAAVVSDPSTGQILAMVSKPGFDANQVSQPAYWQSLLNNQEFPLINRATNGYYPPGSTFKTVTLSAALSENLVNLNTMFYGTDATGPLTVGGHVFPAAINNLAECFQSAPVSLNTAFACSDNIVYAELGLKLGPQRFLNYTHAFGLDQSTPFDIPVSESHVRNPGGPFADVDLASAAFGQGQLHVTPLQMNMIAMAIADNGTIMDPYLVQRVTAPDGSVVKQHAPYALYHPISSVIAGQVRDAMVNVVQTGSGYADKQLGIPVAGKTGTAQTTDGGLPHAWFIAFAPADHPKIAISVIVEHAGEGAVVAAPIACRIIKAALNPPGTCP